MCSDAAVRHLGSWTITPRKASERMPAPIADLPRHPTMAQLQRLQEGMADLPQTPLEPIHHFADGMYGRELFIPAETVVVGKIHRHEHITLLLRGEVTINTDKGMERITGPHVWISPPGAKRALVTHTDCVFFTVHLNAGNSRDLEAIEAEVIIPEPQLRHEPALLSEFADDLQGVFA